MKFPRATRLPDPGKHRTLFYAHYAHRTRGGRSSEGVGCEGHAEEPPKRRRCSPSWARLISKVFHADPLRCSKCGGKLNIIAYVTDGISDKRILNHLGLSPRQDEECRPPELREAVRVPVDEEGREIEAP